MSDYICPECGHTAYEHYERCLRCNCKHSEREVYTILLRSQTQAIKEAREALKPFVENFKDTGMPDNWIFTQKRKVLTIRKAAEWLKKYP